MRVLTLLFSLSLSLHMLETHIQKEFDGSDGGPVYFTAAAADVNYRPHTQK